VTAPLVERDERTLAVENAGYRWSYLVLSFGLLAIAAARSFTRGEEPWDLIALVLLGGLVNAGHQAMGRVLYRRWAVMTAVTIVVAALLAALIVSLRR
jgi:hypothetical protein